MKRTVVACLAALVVGACGGSAGSGDTGTATDGGTDATTGTGSTSVATDGSDGTTGGSTGGSTGGTGGSTEPPPDWDPEVTPESCAADDGLPLMDQVLALTGLAPATFTMTEADFSESSQYNNGVLGGDFAFSWLWDVRSTPVRAGCFDGEVAGVLDGYLQSGHPVAGMIRHLAGVLDRPVDGATPFGPGAGFDAALDTLCAAVGSTCTAEPDALPADLRQALTPLLWALHEGIEARLAMDASPGGAPSFWHENGGNQSMYGPGLAPDAADANSRTYLLGDGPRNRLYRAAAQIAFAIEDVDWSAFAGLTDVSLEVPTNAGKIVVRDGAAHTFTDEEGDVLLWIDLGGDDEYLGQVASNTSAQNPVSVVIDLGGQDTYHYPEVPHAYDMPGLLPSDADGRSGATGNDGNFTLSRRFRQGAARNGIALLFDLGVDDDHYQSLRGSQGYAHQGVGVLFDAGGNDTYLSEASSQGAAQYGIGLLVDADGDDQRRSFTMSQGFGWVGGAGVLVDGGGTDLYDCDVGDPDLGGIPVYHAPQMPGKGNSSFCQGAGFGNRSDISVLSSLSGGLGVLRDVSGNDTYGASLFAQGSGYWEGVGLLSDGDGSDAYDAFWYVQGGVAHYAVGMAIDDGDGDDLYNQTRPSVSMNMGAGHDFSLGVLINEGGNDTYYITGLSSGASNCNGLGLFVDNGGDDSYEAINPRNSGYGNHSNECAAARPDAVSIGVMIDAGGTDTRMYPDTGPAGYVPPTEGGEWGWENDGLPAEHGAGLDAEGVTGVHAGGG